MTLPPPAQNEVEYPEGGPDNSGDQGEERHSAVDNGEEAADAGNDGEGGAMAAAEGMEAAAEAAVGAGSDRDDGEHTGTAAGDGSDGDDLEALRWPDSTAGTSHEWEELFDDTYQLPYWYLGGVELLGGGASPVC